MKKILWCLYFTLACQSQAMQQDSSAPDSNEVADYKTFLFFTWGPALYEFHEKDSQNAHAQKLERFKNNYLCGAILYKHLKKGSNQEAARLSYRTTPSGALALHNILHGNIDDFHEDNYSGMDLVARWRDELEYIEKNLTDSRAK